MAFGVMGAHFQPMGHVYVMSNMFDYGMDAQEALDCPRVFFEGDALLVEETVPERGRRRTEAARPSRGARGDAVGRRADRGHGPRERRADRRLRRAQGRHGHRLLRAQHGATPQDRAAAPCGCASRAACRASATATGPSASPASSASRAGCATAATAASRPCSPARPTTSPQMLERCRDGPPSARVTAVKVVEEGGAAPDGFDVLPTA